MQQSTIFASKVLLAFSASGVIALDVSNEQAPEPVLLETKPGKPGTIQNLWPFKTGGAPAEEVAATVKPVVISPVEENLHLGHHHADAAAVAKIPDSKMHLSQKALPYGGCDCDTEGFGLDEGPKAQAIAKCKLDKWQLGLVKQALVYCRETIQQMKGTESNAGDFWATVQNLQHQVIANEGGLFPRINPLSKVTAVHGDAARRFRGSADLSLKRTNSSVPDDDDDAAADDDAGDRDRDLSMLQSLRMIRESSVGVKSAADQKGSCDLMRYDLAVKTELNKACTDISINIRNEEHFFEKKGAEIIGFVDEILSDEPVAEFGLITDVGEPVTGTTTQASKFQ